MVFDDLKNEIWSFLTFGRFNTQCLNINEDDFSLLRAAVSSAAHSDNVLDVSQTYLTPIEGKASVVLIYV